MTRKNTYRLHDALGYQLSLTARFQERGFEDEIRKIGLTRLTWCILLAVTGENLSRPSEIAEFVGIDRTATSRALRQMEADGLIARRVGEGDKRTTQVIATTEGHSRVAEGSSHAHKNAKHFEAKLTDAESQELRRILSKLRQNEDSTLKSL
ncbi:MarR family winged helix-turn-helix transcriptional regulator [Cochlodiniinecator piscidefendens]|uniref:MarR family winged helix-turn-helix transcriptional regulator n=1 Tax=Cochlodiniinecator piscidefendens TaxID=2715756 RepID=UPI00140762BD|nr:MarR family transcriptional regulator [Cochlodiniinecator piscidefendens]